MTLDEAIKHAEEVAMLNENTCKAKPNLDLKMHRECAEEHRQLAEWLKDYKRLLEQEPCEDAVSRQAVFETIDDCNSDGLKGIFCSYDDGERFKEYIKNLPPVTPTQRWIPVSERLPKISGWYLVTGSRGAISVRYWRKAIPQQGGSYWRGSVNPIAWMPLPEPYKAESEEL